MEKSIRPVDMRSVDVTGGFWYEKQKLIREVSTLNVYERFRESGRFAAFKLSWKEGDEGKPHVYWDSDVAKWIEAVGYISMKARVPELEKIADEVIDDIERGRMADGYFNSYFSQMEPQNRFTRRNDHELYCLGHLIEAAIAYKAGCGKDKLLGLVKDYADLVYRVFYEERSAGFITPGHEELELALVKLYRETGDKKYLKLALYFVDARGTSSRDDMEELAINVQSHLPVRKQRAAVGHAVRACYLYSAIADLARECGDGELFDLARELFCDITGKKMYVTGGIGQNPVGEAFGEEYDLPNQTAYTETCANLSLALFSRRMTLMEPDARYADAAERVLYNSFISGISLDGRSFFYSNMQENNMQLRRRRYGKKQTIFCPQDLRAEIFRVSCCPPNVLRTVASIQDFAYARDEDTLYVSQYMQSELNEADMCLSVKTEYPYDGEIDISYGGKSGRLALRIPAWCKSFKLLRNGAAAKYELRLGYAYVEVEDGDAISLTLDMPIRLVEAHPMVWEDAGRAAVTRGPLVFCIESVDNPYPLADIRLSADEKYELIQDGELSCPILTTTGYIRKWNSDELYAEGGELYAVPIRLIPYFAFANRGECDMIIWALKHN